MLMHRLYTRLISFGRATSTFLVVTYKQTLSSLERPKKFRPIYPVPGLRSLQHKASFYFSLVLGVAWLGPAIFLLVWNLQRHILGASPWCSSGSCGSFNDNDHGATTNQLLATYGEQGRLLTSALQYAAKIMEVWFVFNATSLLYLCTQYLAKKHGIPIRHLLTYLQFTDITRLKTPGASSLEGKKHRNKRPQQAAILYWLFVTLAVVLSIEANLMGPSLAILLIPSLQWVDEAPFRISSLARLYTDLFAGGLVTDNEKCVDYLEIDYDALNVTSANYTCLYDTVGRGLDSIADFFLALEAQRESVNQLLELDRLFPYLSRYELIVAFNSTLSKTEDLTPAWAPVLQAVEHLSDMYTNFTSPSKDTPSRYLEYENSLQVQIQTRAPVMGISYSWGVSNMSRTIVSPQGWNYREIRCYHGYYLPEDPYIKCWKFGIGWWLETGKPLYDYSKFSIASFRASSILHPYETGGSSQINATLDKSSQIDLTTWSSSTPAYLDPTLDIDIITQCFLNGTLAESIDCDWEEIFSRPKPKLKSFVDPQDNAMLVDIAVPYGHQPSLRYLFEVFPSYAIATYFVDPSITSPSFKVVQLNDLPGPNDTTIPLNLDSTWILSAFGIIGGSLVASDHGAVSGIQSAILDLDRRFATEIDHDEVNYLTSNPMRYWTLFMQAVACQAASNVQFFFESTDERPDFGNKTSPILWTRFRRQVWTYGIEFSRVSIMGVVVVIIGCIVVIARLVMKILMDVTERGPEELLIGALEHEPEGEFDNLPRERKVLSKVRMKMEDGKDNRLIFKKA